MRKYYVHTRHAGIRLYKNRLQNTGISKNYWDVEFELSAHEKLAVDASSWMAVPDTQSPRAHCIQVSLDSGREMDGAVRTIKAPMQKIRKLIMVRVVFFHEENHLPLLMYSQKTPLRPYVNQLAKRAVCH